MAAGAARPGTRAGSLAASLALALAAGCASVEPPPGGPEDRTPPRLASAWPESGTVGLGEVRELLFSFSEKVEPRPAERFLRLYPPVKIADTDWSGRRQARVRLAEPLPPDTVIVVEIVRGLPDAHRVPSAGARAFPLATADSLPVGEVAGVLARGGKPVGGAVVELLPVAGPADDSPRASALRRAESDSLGRYRLPWLPVPGGPWLLRAFEDADGDGRPGEREARRDAPDTLWLTPQSARLALPELALFAPDDPGTVAGQVDSTAPWTAPLLGWVERIAETDTGLVARPLARAPRGRQPVERGARVAWDKVGPGLVRLVLFTDLDGDSLPSLVARPPDTVRIWLEPHAWADSLLVLPGLETRFRAPVFPDTLTLWRGAPPESAATDLPVLR